VQRIRAIKPRFFISEAVASVSAFGRLLFIGLWTVADREGRLVWKPKEIKAQIFPHDDGLLLAPLAEELVRAGLVRFYVLDGVTYAWLPGFAEHQRPHPKEPASAIPAWPEGTDRRFRPGPPTADHGGPGSIPSRPVVREGKGREQEGKGTAPLIAPYVDKRWAFDAGTFRIPVSWEVEAASRSGGRLTGAQFQAFYQHFAAWVQDERVDITGNRLFRALDAELARWRERQEADAEIQKGRDTVRQLREMERELRAKQAGGAA
jgi:hypothetical protein